MEPEPHDRAERRRWLSWLALGALWKLGLLAFVTRGVLVDDAYITLRYARHAAEGAGLVYNPGEPVFGVTSPAWAFVTWALHASLGDATPAAVAVLGVLLGSLGAWLCLLQLPPRGRDLGLALCLLAPSLVDNQLLGMETPLFVALVLGAAHGALRGRAVLAASCAGLCVVTRPEGVLLAPFLLWAFAREVGRGNALRELTRPPALAALVGPGLAWCAFALARYGSVLPQSMLAKSGWNSEHYAGLFSATSALLTVPRLTFLPFVDRLPVALALATAVATTLAVAGILAWNARRGTPTSRLWAGFYLAYVAFYLLGKGATEASWYSVPSTVAILLAAGPLLPRPTARLLPAVALALLCASTWAAFVRAGLLRSYVDGYGACARELERLPGEHRVAIGEIGVFGYASRHAVTDVGALVSPEVLPWKNAGHSFARIVRESGADLFVVSQVALDRNHYPSVGPVWADDEEAAWLANDCRLVCRHEDKLAYQVSRALPRAR